MCKTLKGFGAMGEAHRETRIPAKGRHGVIVYGKNTKKIRKGGVRPQFGF